MIITRTPFRMSFIGGGTDYEPFFREHGGCVIATTFDKYCYVTMRHLPPFFEYRNQITYGVLERTSTVDEIDHPAVRNAMKMLDMHDMRIVYEADLPARSGLGSSSSFAVGLLAGFHALKGKHRSRSVLASEAIHLERDLCAEAGGWQDQIEVAYGGLNRIDFKPDGTFIVNPVIISKDRKRQLNNNLMLFFTGFSRVSADIAKHQTANIEKKNDQLIKMMEMAKEAEYILESKQDLDDFGRLLHEAWEIKKGMAEQISNSTLDEIYLRALKAGAIGGKLMGAGGGGFLLLYVTEDKQDAVKKELSDLLYVPFSFEEEGVRILYYYPEDYDFNTYDSEKE